MNSIFLRVLGALQRRCTHPPEHVKADLHEGGLNNLAVQHCDICGAARLRWNDGMASDWRTPRADWCIEP
jgi:hypothetical protein